VIAKTDFSKVDALPGNRSNETLILPQNYKTFNYNAVRRW
jgi:hypothetical protein